MHDVIAGWACIAAAILLPLAVIARAVLHDTRDTTRDVSRLDHLDGVCGCEDDDCAWCAARRGLTEWDLDRDTHDPADLCEAYPHECDWDDVHHTPDPWGPTTRVCHTHHREGADQ